jgi:preprotein translocase subunit SecD
MLSRIRKVLLSASVAAVLGCVLWHGMSAASAQGEAQIELRFVSETDEGDRLVPPWSSDPIVVETAVVVPAGGVREVKLIDDRPRGQRYLSLKFNDSAARGLAEATANASGRKLAMIIGGKLVSVTVVREPLTGPEIRLTGTSIDEIRDAIGQ